MNESEITALLGHPVRLKYPQLVGQGDPGTHAEGTLIGYADEPTVIIETADGTHISWLARLAEAVPEPEVLTPEEELRKRVETAIADPNNWARSLDGSDHFVDGRAILAALYPEG